VIALLNERFIPLKIDAEKEAPLAQSLQVHSYPTIILGAPDGKILGTIVGFKEPAEFLTILQRAVTPTPSSTSPTSPTPAPSPSASPPASPTPPPDWMVRDQQEAAKAIAGSDYTRAIVLLKGILEDGKDRPIQVKAKQMLQDIEQQAAGRL